MPRLVVNPGTDNAWEIPLQPGVISLGRGPENQFPIEHPSVSSTHCQLTVTDSMVVIKDLGSINGTFVDDAMVEEAQLSNGQTVRLGDVAMRFESERISRARPVPVVDPQPPPAVAACKFHPRTTATFRCPKCQVAFCDLCVSLRQGLYFCRACGMECLPLRRVPVPAATMETSLSQLRGAFTYPLKGDGLVLLICGVVVFVVLGFVRTLTGMLGPYGFVLAWMLTVFGMGYVFSYAKSIITSTANNEDAPPDWPEVTEWQEDIVQPFCQMSALLALTFGPAAILRWWQPGSESFAHDITIAAAVFGALLTPMGMLALAIFDRVGALNPILLVVSIFRIPLLYLAVAAVFELLTFAYFEAGSVIGSWIPIPILSKIISVFLNLYLTLAGMRILGLLYRSKADALGWFANK